MGGHARRWPAEPVIVGRDAERGLLSGFLDAGGRAVAAVLTGPAGIGKTALWEWTVEQASRAGYLVLASRAGIAEARLPWVGLTDLLRTAAAVAVLPALPAPQRRALQVVMLQSDGGEVADERTVGTALWSVLATLAQSGPVLIALDDLPYLDAASAGALRFALRRMEPAGRVRLVATARGDGSRWAPVDGLPGDRVMSLEWARSPWARCSSCSPPGWKSGWPGRFCCACTRRPAGIRCTRWNWPAPWTGWR